MSEQSNTSFAHAFLPGLILGLIVGAVAGAFVPEMMSGSKIKIDPSHTTGQSHRQGRVGSEIDAETQAIIDAAQAEMEENASGENPDSAIEDTLDAAHDAVEEVIEDATNNLPATP